MRRQARLFGRAQQRPVAIERGRAMHGAHDFAHELAGAAPVAAFFLCIGGAEREDHLFTRLPEVSRNIFRLHGFALHRRDGAGYRAGQRGGD